MQASKRTTQILQLVKTVEMRKFISWGGRGRGPTISLKLYIYIYNFYFDLFHKRIITNTEKCLHTAYPLTAAIVGFLHLQTEPKLAGKSCSMTLSNVFWLISGTSAPTANTGGASSVSENKLVINRTQHLICALHAGLATPISFMWVIVVAFHLKSLKIDCFQTQWFIHWILNQVKHTWWSLNEPTCIQNHNCGLWKNSFYEAGSFPLKCLLVTGTTDWN